MYFVMQRQKDRWYFTNALGMYTNYDKAEKFMLKYPRCTIITVLKKDDKMLYDHLVNEVNEHQRLCKGGGIKNEQ